MLHWFGSIIRLKGLPEGLQGPDGRYLSDREAYLRVRYPGYQPRNKVTGNRRAGWKNPKLSDSQQNFMYVYWFPRDMGRLFLQAWKLYMYKRLRARISADNIPSCSYRFATCSMGNPTRLMHTATHMPAQFGASGLFLLS